MFEAAVLGANGGMFCRWVVIGVASATHNIWIIFLSGLSAILAGTFSMAKLVSMFLFPHRLAGKRAAADREQAY